MPVLLFAASALAAASTPPCGEVEQCPASYGTEAQELQSQYRLLITTEAEREKISVLVAQHTRDGKTDWKRAREAYFAWLTTKPEVVAPKSNPVASAERAMELERELRRVARTAALQRLVDPQSAQFEWPFGSWTVG